MKKHELTDPAIMALARIVRRADAYRFYLAPQAAGLWAILAGLSYNIHPDHDLLRLG